MVNRMDKRVYFPKSFNEQMSWIDESVEYIIKHVFWKENTNK